MDYMQIVREAFQMVRQNRLLWLLGFVSIIVSLFSNFSSVFQLRFQATLMDPTSSPTELASQMGGWLLFLCFWFILLLVLTVITLSAQGGIVHAVDRIDEGQPITFGDAFRAGWAKVWRLIALLIVLYGPVFVLYFMGVFGVTFMTVLSGDEGGVFLACLLGVFCIFLFLVLLVAFIYPFAMRGIILRGMGIRDSISHGWQVLRGNLGSILVLVFIFFLIYLIIYLVAFAIAAPFALPAFIAQMEGISAGIPPTEIGWFYNLFLPFSLVISLIAVFLTPWQSAVFTLAYKQFTGKGFIEKQPEPLPV